MKVTTTLSAQKLTFLIYCILLLCGCQNKTKSTEVQKMNRAVSFMNNALAGMIIDPAILLKRCDSIGDFQQKYLMVAHKLDSKQREEAKTNLLKLDGIKVIYQNFGEQYAILDYDNQELDAKIKRITNKLKRGENISMDSINYYTQKAKDRENIISKAIKPIIQVENEYNRKIQFCKEVFLNRN